MRCVAAMAGVGSVALAEDAVKRPQDIDMVAVHGLGFARRTGGIMFAADLIGLKEIRQKIASMAEVSSRLKIDLAVIDALIKADKSFGSLNG